MAIRDAPRTPSYDEETLLQDLASGMSYDDFADEYDLDPLDADTVVADLKHHYDIVRRRIDRNWIWVLADPFDALDGG